MNWLYLIGAVIGLTVICLGLNQFRTLLRFLNKLYHESQQYKQEVWAFGVLKRDKVRPECYEILSITQPLERTVRGGRCLLSTGPVEWLDFIVEAENLGWHFVCFYQENDETVMLVRRKRKKES